MAKVNYEKIWKELKRYKQDDYRELLEFDKYKSDRQVLEVNMSIDDLEVEMAEMDELDGTNDKVNFTKQLLDEGLYDKHIEIQENFKSKSTKKETSDDFVSWAWSNQETGEKESPYGVIEKIAKLHGVGKGSE
ncbi:hypothetical protein [Mammaliicoccus lentus]|uniref:Phage protein n=1 Tax=Mammaliicoccus lentus TaxID=42858 RepID=A0ABS6GVH7_MAMLE|nr:hypothetical protein [Mammaliicoccus lentus]MBU6112518.1 hypothetical protein [Mammaliicoccus lentus]